MCFVTRNSAKCLASSGEEGSRVSGKIGCSESKALTKDWNLASQTSSSRPESAMALSRSVSLSKARKFKTKSRVSSVKIMGYLGKTSAELDGVTVTGWLRQNGLLI